MSAVLEEEEEETEEQRYQRFFGPAESSTEDDESDEEEAPPAPRLAIESEASALLAKLIGEVLSEAKTRPERETARLACAAAGSFLAQIPGAAGAFEGEASREDVLAEGPSATLCVARGARFTALDELNDAPPPPVDAGATWACLVGRPWPAASERPARARRYVLAVRRGVVVSATQTSSGALARPDASRQLLALCRCVDALGRCGVDTGAARVHAWVDDEMSGTREAPVAHLVAVEPLGHAEFEDDALAAALGAGPELVYRAVEAE